MLNKADQNTVKQVAKFLRENFEQWQGGEDWVSEDDAKLIINFIVSLEEK